MTAWADVVLGIIAVATLSMAIVQIGVLVAAGLLARRVGRLLDQVELELKPVFGHLNAIGRDASRAAALAAEQVEGVDRLLTNLTERVDETVGSLYSTLAGPAHQGRAIFSAVRAAIRTMRNGVRTGRLHSEDEDTLFI